MSSDEAIQLTNNDASFFKAYAVQKGYWNDAYINIFASTSSLKDDNPLRDHKPPEMSRGCRKKKISYFQKKKHFIT